MNTNTTEGKAQELAPDGSRTHLHAALKEFTTMMVATYDKKGKHPRLHARPMMVASVEPDCSLTFITRMPDQKPGDGDDHLEDGTVIAQSLTRHVSMLGTIEYTQDRRQINEVWRLPLNLFFGKGRDEPSLCLMKFHPRDAELWDLSGRKGLRFLFGAARSLIQRKTPDFAPDQHEKLKLHRA